MEIFAPIKILLKPKNANLFDFTFNLHTKYTVVMILACSVLLCSQFAREPITCLPGVKLVNEKLVDTFCWVNGTWTSPIMIRGKAGELYPGVGPASYDAPKKYQYYYQWLSVVLILQASLFYLPRYIWKMWEGHVFQYLVSVTEDEPKSKTESTGATNPSTNNNHSSKADIDVEAGAADPPTKKSLAPLVRFFTSNSYIRESFVVKYVICELLNTCNAIGQLLLSTYVLGDSFLQYGFNVVQYFISDTQPPISPMDEIFPKLAKCTFYKFGPSGSIEIIDALCVLSWNIIYEKIFMLLWWWFIILMAFSIINWMRRMLTLVSRDFRSYELRSVAFVSKTTTLNKIVMKASFSDIFILCKMGKRVQLEAFDKLLEELSQKMEK